MNARKDYFNDLLNDCLQTVAEVGGDELSADVRMQLVAALVVSDSINGLRKAILTTNGNTRPSPWSTGLQRSI